MWALRMQNFHIKLNEKKRTNFFLDNQLKNPIKQKIYFEKTAPLTFSIKYFVGKCDQIRSFLVY